MTDTTNGRKREPEIFNVRCFRCGKRDNADPVRGGLCIDCYSRVLNAFLMPRDGSEPLKLKAAQAEARMAIERMRAGKDGNPVKPAKPRPTKPKPRAVSKLDVLCALARDPSAGRSIFAATPSRRLCTGRFWRCD